MVAGERGTLTDEMGLEVVNQAVEYVGWLRALIFLGLLGSWDLKRGVLALYLGFSSL